MVVMRISWETFGAHWRFVTSSHALLRRCFSRGEREIIFIQWEHKIDVVHVNREGDISVSKASSETNLTPYRTQCAPQVDAELSVPSIMLSHQQAPVCTNWARQRRGQPNRPCSIRWH